MRKKYFTLEQKAAARKQWAATDRARRKVRESNKSEVRRHGIPESVLSEREGALRAARSLTERIMGDPCPGRSALDKKRAGATG